MLLRYFGRNVKESWANTLLRYCEYRYREKMGRRKERGGLHAIRGTPSILDRRKMARCDEKAREESRQLSRVIDRREIRPEISRSLSRFFSPLPPPAFLPDFLPLVIATRTSEGGREGGERKDIAIGIIYYCFAINGGRVRVVRAILRGKGGREGKKNKKKKKGR